MATPLRDRRQALGFTAAGVARQLGVSEWTVRSWEMGRTRPTKRHANRLARVLKATLEELGLTGGAQGLDSAHVPDDGAEAD